MSPNRAGTSHAADPSQVPSETTTAVCPDDSNKLHCDVCWGRPKKQGMVFQQCRSCRVGVHNECYGIPGTEAASPDFQCRACQAVGTTVTVRQRDVSGQRIRLRVEERPTECCLCSVDDGNDWYHAMHPIYDHYGLTGRQVLLPPDAEHRHQRLAWGHTLCCFAINSHPRTAGCVYGCTADGGFDGIDGDDDNSDASSVNSDLLEQDTDTDHENWIHHFVYCLRLHKHDADNMWTKTIHGQQKQLKCHVCGSDDRHSYRIPIQCSANDESEFKGFRKLHRDLRDDTCYMSMHVGCSIWGRNDAGELPLSRRVYFFPGRDVSALQKDKKTFTSTVINIFCPVHSQDLVGGKSTMGAELLRYPDHFLKRKAVAPAAPPPPQPTGNTANSIQQLARQVELRGQARFLTESRGNKHFGDVRSRLGLRILDDLIIPRAPEAAAGAKRKVPPLVTGAHSTANHQQQKAPRRSSKEVAGLEGAVAQHPQEAPRREVSPPEHPVTLQAGWEKACRKVKADLRQSLASVDTSNEEAVNMIRKQVRKRWKQNLLKNGLGAKQFQELWREVWGIVADELEATTTAAQAADMDDDSLTRRPPLQDAAGSERDEKIASVAGLRPSEPPWEATAAVQAASEAREGASLESRSSLPTPKESVDLIEMILNEIVEKEEEGTEHLDDILKEMEKRWREQLDYSPAAYQMLWKKVLDAVLTKLEYCMEESDEANGAADLYGSPKWDTVEVLSVGYVPEEYDHA